MLKELLKKEFPGLLEAILPQAEQVSVEDEQLIELTLSVHQLISRQYPTDPKPLVRMAEAHHLKGDLRTALHYYRKALELDPPRPLTDMEQHHILRFAPILQTNRAECFALLDVVAVHHPSKPLIGFHLFWEDDYDYPDDFEPCDHEQVWIAYDPLHGAVTGVWSFFHSLILTTSEAVTEANENEGKAVIRVEWGKHGSLLKGWEKVNEPNTGRTLMQVMEKHFHEVSQGGRAKDHPLKRWWPERFEGTFRDYLDFSNTLDTGSVLAAKRKMCKAAWSNAVLQRDFLPYNFHPKFDWPDAPDI